MFELKGKYNTAKVFTDNVEETAMSQIVELCNQEFTQGSKIRIMPDTHAGAGCTIGTTMTIQDKIVPNLVGVDIGCGMYLVKLYQKDINLELLDNVIDKYIPSGFNIRKEEYNIGKHGSSEWIDLTKLRCLKHVNLNRAKLSIGTLGGGNHFIELNKDDEDNLYLVVHTGSRNLGKQVAEYYQDLGYKTLNDNREEIQFGINKLKSEGKFDDIQDFIKANKQDKFPKHLAWVEGNNYIDYLHDMEMVQKFAHINRYAIIWTILNALDINFIFDYFETVHNYINTNTNILRKGAVSARNNERLLIPINMRDGSLLCVGKGNEDWNCSAPHGAGRLMSRSKAKESVTMEEYQQSMNGIFTTSVNQSTLDECPMAYKPMQEIIDNIQDTVEIIKVIKPIYNFKAGE